MLKDALEHRIGKHPSRRSWRRRGGHRRDVLPTFLFMPSQARDVPLFIPVFSILNGVAEIVETADIGELSAIAHG